MLSLPADKVDEVINELTNFLEPEDIVADLGNSLFEVYRKKYSIK